MKNILKTNLMHFNWDNRTRTLSMPFAKSFPSEIIVDSHHTGSQARFIPVPIDHKYFDEDGWDGEQMVYIPASNGTKVEKLVLFHF